MKTVGKSYPARLMYAISIGLRARIRDQEFSIEDLADCATVSEQTVRNMLSGSHVPRVDKLGAVLQVLGTDLAEFFAGLKTK